MSALKPLSPADVSRRLAKGKITLVDVRERREYASEHIAGALSMPLSDLRSGRKQIADGQPVVFHCKSGMRTQMHCDDLAAKVTGKAYVLEGGLRGWKQAGLPVEYGHVAGLGLRPLFLVGAAAMVTLGLITLLTRAG
ncbi:MAG: hypothetical protein GYB49_12035 [Alphaproteobacteria bacterium]|nr:hypothetical protein [Hyphomonas sp.]MBR9807940.1 hypothetical protein [Alphaproteobacteria bacterium]